MSILNNIKQRMKKRFFTFLDKRMPSIKKQTLTQRNIFIIPSRFGVGVLFFILLLFVLGTNYQNNLILFVSYLLSSIFIIAMLYSFQNLSQLQVSGTGINSGFQNQNILIKLGVNVPHDKYNFIFQFESQKLTRVGTIDPQRYDIKIPVCFERRGRYRLSRLLIKSEFPLGLFRTWTNLQFPIEVLVYPEPLRCSFHSSLLTNDNEINEETNSVNRQTGDDFYELVPYQQGHSLTQVAWKQVAKGQGWHIKRNANYSQPEHITLRFDSVPANQVELKLKQLCFLVLSFSNEQQMFSLELPFITISAGTGNLHRTNCLDALATYGSVNE